MTAFLVYVLLISLYKYGYKLQIIKRLHGLVDNTWN